MLAELGIVSRRLAEAVIKGTQSSSRHVGNHTTEGLPALFILVEAPVNQFSQEATALGNTKPMRPLDDRLSLV